MRHEDARLTNQSGPILRDLCLDAVDVVADVDAIYHGLLVSIVLDEITAEEPDGLPGRRGGQADETRIKVFEDLSPDVIDR